MQNFSLTRIRTIVQLAEKYPAIWTPEAVLEDIREILEIQEDNSNAEGQEG